MSLEFEILAKVIRNFFFNFYWTKEKKSQYCIRQKTN